MTLGQLGSDNHFIGGAKLLRHAIAMVEERYKYFGIKFYVTGLTKAS
ncbi:hypothetical protein NHP190012_11200 [Helicobacter sp. NHP19-012]|uniref:Uncharacterized protein n=1 Tax=Helicobacter gastrofelis TaxID=2849642 RepID=A0ABN6I7M4_9HELI|nr:hypothetical protein NHP190012_11200 [Helicobacter sp. NHP19-012]GMB96465.1 hypothetical protein NHP22001_10540 [Helicobacter sp. NHP22-001]